MEARVVGTALSSRGPAFAFNPAAAGPAPLPSPPAGDRRGFLAERVATTRRDLADAGRAGRRGVLVRALERELAALDAELAVPDPPGAGPGPSSEG